MNAEETMSDQQKHTRGPWSIGGRNIIIGHTPLLVEIATVNDGGLDLDDSDNEAAAAVVTANARLIAAAPDLLAACEAALRMVEGDGLPPNWDLLRTAIRKAKGEA